MAKLRVGCAAVVVMGGWLWLWSMADSFYCLC
jgi:hypothetical protein